MPLTLKTLNGKVAGATMVPFKVISKRQGSLKKMLQECYRDANNPNATHQRNIVSLCRRINAERGRMTKTLKKWRIQFLMVKYLFISMG